MDKMALTASNGCDKKDEDAIIDALTDTNLCHEDDLKREEKNKVRFSKLFDF